MNTNQTSPNTEGFGQILSEVVDDIGWERFLTYLPHLLSSRTNGTPTSENAFFEKFVPALKASSHFDEIKRQYAVGKYKVDCMLVSHMNTAYDDGTTSIYKSYVILEYDEDYHSKDSQLKKDLIREQNITEELKKQTESCDSVRIEIFRINEKNEHYAFLYLLPFLAGIETSYTSDRISDYIDWRELYSRNAD